MSNYYQKGALFPKPGNSKKRKKENGYKDKVNRRCRYTGMPYAERHELFGGTGNRQNSIDEYLQVDLHPYIHKLFHGERVADELLQELHISEMFPDPIEWAENEVRMLKRDAQLRWEIRTCTEKGLNMLQARAAWMELIGVNYLDN